MKQRFGMTMHNVKVCILFFMIIVMYHPTNVASRHFIPLTNQLQTSALSKTSQLINPQENHFKKSAVIKSSNPVTHQQSINMDEVEMILETYNNKAFFGYTIFVLEEEIPNPQNSALEVHRSLVVINMTGDTISESYMLSFPPDTWVFYVEFINSTTLLYGTTKGAALWNIYDGTKVNLGFYSHHEYEYNPLNNTFFAFRAYIEEIEETKYEFDMIEEYNTTGHLIWSLDTHSFISHTQWCPYHDAHNGTTGYIVDLLHSNSIFFDAEEDVFYYHPRNLNTFYKIDHKTGKVIWGLGEYGNFTLFDRHGNPKHALFYHAHAVEKVDEDTFILFDNDYHNQTNPSNQRSRILEIQINETTMTAKESWAWTAPLEYYSVVLGDADRLPNGNRLGVFGAGWPPFDDKDLIGPRLIEVSDAGQIIWELDILNPENSWYNVYRLELFRLTPILDTPPDIRRLPTDDAIVSWQTWYNFRTNCQMKGSYKLYLDGHLIENGTHVFGKFWRPTTLTTNLGKLESGDYNLTLVLADEAGHITTDSVMISILPFYISCEGPLTIELGQENSLLQWKGDTPRSLIATITRNGTEIASFAWNGSIITLDLNSFEPGTYLVELHLFDYTGPIYDDSYWVTIYPSTAPNIMASPSAQSLLWNTSLILSWEFFDHNPSTWNILVNATPTASGTWGTQNYHLNWSVPNLAEGIYNITLLVYDRIGNCSSRTIWLTVHPPSPPVIVPPPPQTKVQWGQENTSLRWEVHGGTNWILWKNGIVARSGEVTNSPIEVEVEDWSQGEWNPGMYNLTLQVIEEDGNAVTHTILVQVWVDLGDSFADSIVTGASMWYWDGENALGPPDSLFSRLFTGYGNGHLTLDMGLNEEILDGFGHDFTVYARGGEYLIFVGNNLTQSIFIGKNISAPLLLLGTGVGNTSFDLSKSGLVKVRYIQIIYLTGDYVELDAVEAVHFNRPPQPPAHSGRWKFLLPIIIVTLSIIGVIWVHQRKR